MFQVLISKLESKKEMSAEEKAVIMKVRSLHTVLCQVIAKVNDLLRILLEMKFSAADGVLHNVHSQY